MSKNEVRCYQNDPFQKCLIHKEMLNPFDLSKIFTPVNLLKIYIPANL